MAQAPLQRLLLVDDDVQVIFQLKHILDGCAQIFFATSGEAALRQMRREPFDLVLLDAEMPGMSGLEVCAAMCSEAELQEIPVIFVTAHHGADEESRALDAGAMDFIPKPVNPAVARARVRTQLALKARTDALRRLSEVDSLTRIANRRAFDRALEQEWRRAMRSRAPLSLLLIDVDHFKRYNDAHGHFAGDACLAQVASALASTVQRTGDMAARYGGEEFALVLPCTDAMGARRVGEMVCERMRELAIPHGDSPVSPLVTLSVGAATVQVACAQHPSSGKSCLQCGAFQHCCDAPQSLVELADQALYAAKAAGRSQVRLAGTFEGRADVTPGMPRAVRH
ncbi:diguanylate cyclase domain-containing protein [Azohydromonas aeria]|uniref:diguanylate cyclase domain-containing protein n=1 Tax=Azohydromonas aeria TaxID=2590212 RepID=UPI0012F90251|nr:diguanylate cyclase [Azohydromonas aeria]